MSNLTEAERADINRKIAEGARGTKTRRLTCACCGANTTGRQWHNQDTGYSLCHYCAGWIGERETPDYMVNNYGARGIHYDLEV